MKQRIPYIDLLKLVAIACVVVCHVPMGMDINMMDNSLPTWEYLLNAIGVLGVPLFMMCSGALVLGKDFSTHQQVARFYKRNLWPIYLTGATWCLLYYFANTDAPTAKGIVKTALLVNKPEAHLWYVRMILLYYLFMPLLSNLRQKHERSFVCAVAVAALLTFGWNVARLCQHEPAPTTSGLSLLCYLVYLALGYYFTHRNWNIPRLALLAACLASTVFLTYIRAIGVFSFMWYDNPLALLASASAFLLAKRFRPSETVQSRMAALANMTFGVYLSHVFILKIISLILKPTLGGCEWLLFASIGLLVIFLTFSLVRLALRVLPPPFRDGFSEGKVFCVSI